MVKSKPTRRNLMRTDGKVDIQDPAKQRTHSGQGDLAGHPPTHSSAREEQPKVSVRGQMDEQTVTHPYDGILLGSKKEQSTNESPKHYSE